ncbi:hypothetical protein B0T24DRAFT_587856 [Lasiosphaeria ovina]|uniref:Uncharacterized protein n=1 Tax=Lasiosphaeria ovina TaxID=92902 RepID=A0AAE0NKM2_9PEZI|nr:hypothetical protein B0T24DRAFT_587856 [Lasiosphaeria ovina]
MGPSSHKQNDGWVVIDKKFSTKGYTKSRSPQYNGDNESSGEVGNASTGGSTVLDLSDESMNSGCDDQSPADRKKAGSNRSSTETGCSDDTVVDFMPGQAARDRTTTTAAPSICSSTPHHALTEDNIEAHLRELEERLARDIYDTASMDFMSGRHIGMLAGNSKPSTPSSVSLEWSFVPLPVPDNDDTAWAGAWCDSAIEALLSKSSQLRLDGE